MFSIAAINDIDSTGQWEPLAPTKEAQEFHLTQTYHEGLLKLQAKDFEEAHKLLESVLKDPLVSSAQVDTGASDGHLLQLRFLALKNLATVSLQQGSDHYEKALHCYLQAVEIDSKDSVVWNQLGTLSCTMGLLSISRWAFEQGLSCSPNNWTCMEKLLEVLIAIGDEVACLSVAELILRHWPSHSRALHVKTTIDESEPVPFAPRGIDKLEPKHVRLKFLDKRKERDMNLDDRIAVKKANQNIELHLAEVSWTALADSLLGILLPLGGSESEMGNSKFRSGDIRLIIILPSSSVNILMPVDRNGENTSLGDCSSERPSFFKEKESNVTEEPHERRSTRLERLRSRKPGKEELDFANRKDLAKVVIQYLEAFIVGRFGMSDCVQDGHGSSSSSDQAIPVDTEYLDLTRFVRESSKNYGAYHLTHLLLEEAASNSLLYHEAFLKFLELEKLTRDWGKDRSPECNLFLAELYYDIGSSSADLCKLPDFVTEASYHLSKIIESVALNHACPVSCDANSSSVSSFQGTDKFPADDYSSHDLPLGYSFLTSNNSFWVRFFWLSGHLSIVDGNKAKAHEEFCIALSLLRKKEDENDSHHLVRRPHCKSIKNLTVNTVLHEINILKIDFLLERTVGEMFEKEMYLDCIDLLAPLLFSAKDARLDVLSLPFSNKKGEETTTVELSALDILIKACEKSGLMDMAVYMNCHKLKLQILIVAAGMDEFLSFNKSFDQKSCPRTPCSSEMESKVSSNKQWDFFVAEEVKAISECLSQVKNFANQPGDNNSMTFPIENIGDLQSLLLAVMCNIASTSLCKITTGLVVPDQSEQKQMCCFVHAATAFCKLQHLITSVPVKTQVDLIVAIHDLLAEYGLCCAGEDGKGEEGTFLKFGIKRLLALDMWLKSNLHSSTREGVQCSEQVSHDGRAETSFNESQSEKVDVEMGCSEIDETGIVANGVSGDITDGISSHSGKSKDHLGEDKGKKEIPQINGDTVEKEIVHFVASGELLTEDEREELELKIDNALDQCFFCLYGLNLRSDSSYEDDLVTHKNTSRGDYQTKEQCADVFQYILPNAKASSRTGLAKLRRVLRAIRKHFPQPPEDVLSGNAIDKFLDDPELCEDKLSEEAGTDGFLTTIMKTIFPDSLNQCNPSPNGSSEPYMEVYHNLYYLLAQSEEMNATDKWPGFVLTKEGEEFVQQNANLFKYDLLYNPLRFESWQRLGNIYDEEVDLLLNDGSKHINVVGWRKNATLSQRVETSRRRSRRCLLMSLALAKASTQQSEIHELLALVYYDSLQNVVPFYDQRFVLPSKDAAWVLCCENSMRHFEKAFAHKQDWSHVFYMGKLSEKIGHVHVTSLSYYEKAITLNPSSVDSVYRMHASRLKMLWTCGNQNLDALKVLSAYSFNQSVKDDAMNIFHKMALEVSNPAIDKNHTEEKSEESFQLEEVWRLLYNDCLTALEACIEGDLKHFHKARYMIAQGLYRRGDPGDLERAKDELSFCFKSSRSSFTINMWEIDGMVKKGRRKTPGIVGNKKALEVNRPESSRKFISCIRKYLLFYLKLLEETRDICTLDRAYTSIRADKRFSLCIEDIVPVSLGRYIKTLMSSMRPAETVDSNTTGIDERLLEKMFALFVEQGLLWPEIFSLPEIKSPEIRESILYGYLHQYILLLERCGKLETIEAINEKIRKRFKNPKLSNSNCMGVCKHASVAWCRSLIICLALITPMQSGPPSDKEINQSERGSENSQLLSVDLQINELWSSSFDDSTHLTTMESKWSPMLSKFKNIIIKRTSDKNLETANSLLRSSYNFYRDSSSVLLPSGVNLYSLPSRLVTETQIQPGVDGVEVLDLSIPRKLLLWAYTLLHGRCANIAIVVKHCEENIKSKMKKGAGTTPVASNASIPTTTTAGGARDGTSNGGLEAEATPVVSASLLEGDAAHCVNPQHSRSGE